MPDPIRPARAWRCRCGYELRRVTYGKDSAHATGLADWAAALVPGQQPAHDVYNRAGRCLKRGACRASRRRAA